MRQIDLGGTFVEGSMTKALQDSSAENTGARTLSGLRYRPIIELGHGGMANVLLSVGRGPSGFNKLVVLKTMRKELVADEDLRQMFLAEARLSARLNHANVVQVYEVVDTALPCIIMEYLEGQPMSFLQRTVREHFTLPMQLKVISEALSGLHYSHELCDYDGTPLDIVHRDVSPQNIFITYDGVVKVLDFGIAKTTEANNQTRTGVIKGKISYMPREQLLGEPVDRRADVYAVGCMLWHAAAGSKLWHDVPEGDVMRALIDGKIPKPSSKRPVDRRLENIIMRALAPNASDRYATALALRRELEQYLAENSPKTSMRDISDLMAQAFAQHREARRLQIHQALSAAPSEPPPPIPEGIESLVRSAPGVTSNQGLATPQKSKAIWIALAVLVVAILAISSTFAYVAWRGGRAPAPSVARPATVNQVQIRIAAEPPAAALSVDGKALEGNPATLTVPGDSLDHEIHATLSGYEAFKKTVRFERDLSLDIMLQPTPPAPGLSASADVAKPNVPALPVNSRQPPAPKKNKTNCDPPFYYENGIKTYKPGCL
jgi:eukaryotic-like serine/threonine-protein kinase